MNKNLILLLIASFLLSSCFSIDSTEGLESRAEKLDSQKSTRTDVLELPQVSLSFLVRNKTRLKSFCIDGGLLIPVGQKSNKNRQILESLPPEEGFLVEIGVKPKTENVSVNFKNINLKNGGDIIYPTKFIAWNGGPECQTLPAMDKKNIAADIQIDNSSHFQCFMLSFPITPIPPEDHFSIEVNGIKVNNKKIDVPAINFTPKTYRETTNYGERGC